MRARRSWTLGFSVVGLAALVSSCSFDAAYRDVEQALARVCDTGVVSCRGEELSRCEAGEGSPRWVAQDKCAERGLVCVSSILRCAPCRPEETRCEGHTVTQCALDASGYVARESCDTSQGFACRSG